MSKRIKTKWHCDLEDTNWCELSELYRIAPLGEKTPIDLEIVFTNSKYTCFGYIDNQLIAAGRALADGLDCSYICDVVIHPDYQGVGIGTEIMNKLIKLSASHKKIILYAKPGKENFYRKLKFMKMKTAMAIFKDNDSAIDADLICEY